MISIRQLIFYISVFIITYLIYIYPFQILNYIMFESSIFSFTSIIITFILYFIIIFYLKSNNTFFLLKFFIYEGLGIGFISFWVMNMGLIYSVFYSINSHEIGFICLFLIITITIYSIINGRLIKLKKVIITTSKVDYPVRIIFISDTHLGSNSKFHLENIILKIKNMDFDIFIIGGDFIDSSSFEIDHLKILQTINKPILFISGNHEYYIKDSNKKLNQLKRFNLKFLDNEAFLFKKINFIGISDNQTVGKQTNTARTLIQEGLFNLIIVHKPSLWDYVSEESDLMISGHTHNGQIFPFNFFVKFQFKYIYGLYGKLASKLYVSSGSGCWGPKMRLGTKNEIVDILIKNH